MSLFLDPDPAQPRNRPSSASTPSNSTRASYAHASPKHNCQTELETLIEAGAGSRGRAELHAGHGLTIAM